MKHMHSDETWPRYLQIVGIAFVFLGMTNSMFVDGNQWRKRWPSAKRKMAINEKEDGHRKNEGWPSMARWMAIDKREDGR